MGLGIRGCASLIRDLHASTGAAGHVAMLHTGRVGSTVVAKLLEQHPLLAWEGEIFERRQQRKRARERDGVPLNKRDLVPPLVDLRARVGAAARDGLRYGFETKHHPGLHARVYRLAVNDYVERLGEMGFDHFIEVRRENYLRQVASAIRLGKTGKSHVRVGETVDRSTIRIDVGATRFGATQAPLCEQFARLDELHEETQRALQSRNALLLTYERDIERDPTCAYQQICRFVGLEPVSAEVKLRRTNDVPLSGLIDNFDEVADALAGTRYGWMLELGDETQANLAWSPTLSDGAGLQIST